MPSVSKTGLFAVGCDQSPGWSGLEELREVEGDLTRVGDALVARDGGRGLAARDSSIIRFNEESTNLLDQFDKFLQKLGPDALAIFYFAGHAQAIVKNDLRLLCADSDKRSSKKTTLSVGRLIEQLEESRIAQWAVILDCCQAGTVLLDDAVAALMKDANEGTLIACGTNRGIALEIVGWGGLFTYYLIEAISRGLGMAVDEEFIDLVSAARWAQRQIGEHHSEYGAPPQLKYTGGGEFHVATHPGPPLPAESIQVHTVLFIGAPPEEATEREEELLKSICSRVGRILANNGATLSICNPWHGAADYHVALGYAGYAHAKAIRLFMPDGPETKKNHEAFLEDLDNRKIDLQKTYWYPVVGLKEFAPETWLYCQLQAIERADAIVAVGGATGRSASILLRIAESRGIPIVPFSSLRGAAKEAFERRRDVYDSLGISKHLERHNGVEELGTLLRTVALARAIPPSRISRVFVSRAQGDAAMGEVLATELRKHRIEAVFGDSPVAREQDAVASIQDKLKLADAFIVLWSRYYALSVHCYDELEMALKRLRSGSHWTVWVLQLDETPIVPVAARSLTAWYTPNEKSLATWASKVATHAHETSRCELLGNKA